MKRSLGSYANQNQFGSAWQTSRSSFEISEHANELRYNAEHYEADRILEWKIT